MSQIRFEWDPRKEATNESKHGVTFEEASTAFLDENGVVVPDPAHSDSEDRFVLLGLSARLRLLVVVHCSREADLVIRIISARKANKREQSDYFAQ